MRGTSLLTGLWVALAVPGAARCDLLQPDDWPQFRGANAAGVATGATPPVAWDVTAGRNVDWKTEIPGLGLASPIVCGNQVIIVTAVGATDQPVLRTGLYGDIEPVDDEGPHTWEVYSLSLNSGRVLWKRTLHDGLPAMKRHTKSSHANATPATDGEHIVVNLASEGLYCLGVDGGFRWRKSLGELDSGYYVAPAAQWGYASSPIIYRGMVIVLADVQKGSFLAAFDVRSGRELWRTDRRDVPTWGTPTVIQGPDAAELVVNGYRETGGYDPATGSGLWTLAGGGDIPVPTPIAGHGLIYLSSAHGARRPLRAIRPGARGDLSADENDPGSASVAWTRPKDGIYLQTPIVYGPHLYACRNNGVLSCYEAKTGERLYRKRLGSKGGFTASPVAANGRIYFTSEEGEVYVVQPGEEYKLLATNEMNAICLATPAISKSTLIVRSTSHVYGIKEKPKGDENFIVDALAAPAEN